jgi:putative acetyltransferase
MGITALHIREYEPTDSEALAALFFRTIRTVNLGDYTQEQVEAWAPVDRDLVAWAKRFEGRHTFVAEVDGQIAGFAELDPSGHIDRFYVGADFLGRGVGKELFLEVERKALCLQIRRLDLEGSITARPFFERCGFRVIKEQTVRPRGVAMNNFVMEKELPILPLIRRTSARILLLTPEREVLLVKIANPSGGWVGWITPGGGIEAGETEEAGLKRELKEELGFPTDGSERKVWTRTHRFPWNDKILEQSEVYFLRHCRRFEPGKNSEVANGKMPDYQDMRWWEISQILSSDESFAPRRLGHFLDLLTKGIPAAPIDVGI